MKKIFLLGLTIILSLIKLSFADTSTSIPVSFTIPVMPGINAPAIEEEKLETEKDSTVQQDIKNEKEIQKQPTLIQQDIQEEKVIKDQKTTIVMKTIYSR